jgi:hypothetical protein
MVDLQSWQGQHTTQFLSDSVLHISFTDAIRHLAIDGTVEQKQNLLLRVTPILVCSVHDFFSEMGWNVDGY